MQDKSEIWRYFYEAALGLHYLHSEKVVHGEKCNNIVIGTDDMAKICDFGFSYIRSQCSTQPAFASDVFSFGMCIIEAFSDELPYTLYDDDTILGKIFSGEEYPRPEGIADDEWALVKRITNPNLQQRIDPSVTIPELKMFADRKNERNNVGKTGCVCLIYSAMVDMHYSFCGACGHRDLKGRKSSSPHKRKRRIMLFSHEMLKSKL
ncbi:hypothetical protein PHYPSEUDO_011470 [Phytophthora pseudosyringae]|uniref:non-specific serine/threonine protein kinase n=1 Tax=Phytophthora pseudosyringae TaxID=221518 RepID=A0A8T1W662_9STRA|nr:hypothetical protein PHYPSEUDO_011470 [Phytophthora pseudosyringae]